MTPRQLEILQHSLGVDQYGRGTQYRNRFVTDPSGDDFRTCTELVQMGHMATRGAVDGFGGMHLFWVTDAGKNAMRTESPAPPKITRGQRRYERYLRSDSSMTFGEWLKYQSRPRCAFSDDEADIYPDICPDGSPSRKEK